mmetsp:Transcript_59273/g.105352  ORF Transcript_59273/g.105352 Transcript_59273/m.105352 type:complete len:544 (+) Transcript_59273:118-1749(+)|eukprot:CAMPEP_0197649382 /NCGR_PEP_ID=MMETSP1338-20131121/28317_1 /TAXON_ID=43686 ORGANISM="Pelagodinium beii, Strain RCC1491" /NCGR_SAMPLE_ID=MMETSP1338 /ASSEMBLY_ACC=CAM_ASM_000754 /LENGTH=543 /DNA_ID=CAMNT_0043223547 /DNA_START=100 /DNA_END=1731 /DNA_ORIENTATION=+
MAPKSSFVARAATVPFFCGLISCEAAVVGTAFLSEKGSEKALLAELEQVMGFDHGRGTEARIESIEDALRPMFTSLPKNSRGALRPSTVRYALHRLFTQRHGWQFVGLHSGGEAWGSMSPATALGDRVPQDVQTLFEARLQEQGLDLHELAVLAATLENMVHSEADIRLKAAMNALGKPLNGMVNLSEATEVIDTYMSSFVLGDDISQLSPSSILEKARDVSEQYPSWPETQKFLRQVQEYVAPDVSSFGFTEISDVLVEVGERYGRWQSSECHDLKQVLLASEEHPNTGRIRLSEFYGLALHQNQWQFSESVAYLRQLGALDESDPSTLRVILPNYILGPSNCLASSGYYAVCCIDECEAHLASLERGLGSKDASAADILQLVGANQTMAPSLQIRLKEISEHHGGKVPLHGRLFAQWLHHVYPHECPYPHMSGTTNPLRADQFEASGQTVGASQDEMQQHVEGASRKKPPTHEEGMCSSMWTLEEELVDEAAKSSQSSTRPALQGLVFAGAATSLVITLLKTAIKPVREAHGNSDLKVYSV